MPRASKTSTNAARPSGRIHVGIGGWVYAPWRDNFYPKGLVHRRELEHASRQVTAIEINATFYGAQKPPTYARWRDETPEGFVFSAKAPARITMARDLSKTGGAIADFLGGLATLGARLGPVVWQFEQQKTIDRDRFVAFLDLLPAEAGSVALRHALDVRDPDFVDADYVRMARSRGFATVFTDSTEHPSFADVTADFVYARLMRSRADIATGYAPRELGTWARTAREWAGGGDPAQLPHLDAARPQSNRRDVFVYFIASAKERNPAAAMALLERLGAR